MTADTNEALDALVNALRSGEQADMDGVMVRVSRQACEEAADMLTAQAAKLAEAEADADRLAEALRYRNGVSHDEDCPAHGLPGAAIGICDCGSEDAIDALANHANRRRK